MAIVIGLMCGKANYLDCMKELLEKMEIPKSEVQRIEYRGNGWPGALTVHLKNGESRAASFESYYSAFFNNPKTWCAPCHFCSEFSQDADIVVGDPWGLKLEKNDKQGKTLVVCRNKKSDALVRQAEKEGFLILEKCSRIQFVISKSNHVLSKIKRKHQKGVANSVGGK